MRLLLQRRVCHLRRRWHPGAPASTLHHHLTKFVEVDVRTADEVSGEASSELADEAVEVEVSGEALHELADEVVEVEVD